MKITVLVGNPKSQSRTRQTAEAVADAIDGLLPAGSERLVIDLADYAGRLFDWSDAEVAALNAAVAGTDVLVVASPTYKATYTGLLKAFLDRYDTNGLAGVVAVPVMTGGAPDHSLSVETYLRPLLVELGASVPTRGLYLVMSKMPELKQIVDDWAAANGPVLSAVVRR